MAEPPPVQDEGTPAGVTELGAAETNASESSPAEASPAEPQRDEVSEAEARFARLQERQAAEAAEAARRLEELAELEARIGRQRAALSVATPERQRLVILGWLARARACQEEAPRNLAVAACASRIVNSLLRPLSDTLWPGMIVAFLARAKPQDTGKDLRGLCPQLPSTWREVVAAARDVYEKIERDDIAAGRDSDGWADAAQLLPPPAESEFEELVAEIEEQGGPLGTRQSKESPAPEAGCLLHLAQRARWTRGVADEQTWGLVMGRLRFWVQQRRDAVEAREVLDPAYRPGRSWSTVFHSDEERQRQEELLRDLLERVPGEGATRDAVVGWLLEALPLTSNHQEAVTEAAARFAGIVCELDCDELPGSDRRLRRRLRKLQQALGGESDSADEPVVDAAVGQEVVRQPVIDDELLERTRGKRVLFVSNRTDTELQTRLSSRFGFGEIEWAEATPRRINSAVSAIGSRSFDLVLGATGFLDHAVDGALANACRSSAVPYVRVDRGRPKAVELALHRDLLGS